MAFKTANGAENHIGYGDNVNWDNNAAQSWAFHITPTAIVNNGRIWMKGTGSVNTTPFDIHFAAGGLIRLRVADGVASTVAPSTTACSLAVDSTVVIIFNSTTVRFIINGTDDGTSALVEAMMASAEKMVLGGLIGGSTGMNAAISHAMMWKTELSLAEAEHYRLGGIPDPANLVFWQPGYSVTAPDYISGAAATKTGTVTIVQDNVLRPPRSGRNSTAGFNAITALTKVIDEVQDLVETHPEFLGLLKIIDEVLDLVESETEFLGVIQVIDEILNLLDGDNNNLFDPAGNLQETMSDGTVWTTVYPPFIKRTQWT